MSIGLKLPKNSAIIHEQMDRQGIVSARDYSLLLHYELVYIYIYIYNI